MPGCLLGMVGAGAGADGPMAHPEDWETKPDKPDKKPQTGW